MKNYFRSLVFVYFFHLLFIPLSLAEEPRLLIGREYYQVIKDNLIQAKEEIIVVMYFIIEDETSKEDLVGELVNELIQAHLRGVRVKVILEDSKFKENRLAYERLAQAGVEVYFDTPDKLLHCKVVIIDNELVSIGSTNWSRAAFESNYEAACIFHSKEKAGEIKKTLLDRIGLGPCPQERVEEKGITIPVSLIISERGLSCLVGERSEKSFDLYLLLLKEGKPVGDKLYLDYPDLARRLGYDTDEKRNGQARERVRRALMILANTYDLIEYNQAEHWVVIRSLEKPSSDFPGSIIIPFSYWEYGLSRSLSLSAKYMYLVSLLETKRSRRNPYWFRSQEDMASLYHLSAYTISLALQELEREEIIEISRSVSSPGEYGERLANIYSLNPLVTSAERASALESLKIKYGADMVNKAQGLSRVLNEPYDLADIKTFILLIQTYGYQTVLEANNLTAQYKKGSGLFNITTTINALRKLK